MRSWPVQEAKAKFSALLEASITEGPQVVTRRGVEAAVVVPIEEWKRMQAAPHQRSLKELLLAPHPRGDDFKIPPRRKWKMRPPIVFE